MVVRALRRWARETGEPPREAQWRAPGGKREREYPAWPSATDVRTHFATWPQALEAAGLRPHRRAWTRQQVIRALRAWRDEHGRPPRHDEWARAGDARPPATTVSARFGTWSSALESAGLPTVRHAWTREHILAGLKEFASEHGRPPSTLDLRDTRGTPYPPGSAVQRTFGSHRAALAQLGWSAGWTSVTDADIVEALRVYERDHGTLPTCAAWRSHRRRPGASVIIRRHGTWSAARPAAAAA
jgi:hypothetical protein